MKHFENNVNDGMSRTDSIETLIDLTSCIAVNALMVAGGEAEADEKDAGAWWAMIALAEAALESYPEDVRAKGYQVVNENTNRELVEQARRKEARAGRQARHEHHLRREEGGLAMALITTQPVSARALFKQSTIKGDEAVLQFTVRMDSENAFLLMKKTGGYVILTVKSEQKTIEFDDETGEVWDE